MIGDIEHLDALQRGVVRVPERGEDFKRGEAAAVIEPASFSVSGTGARCGDSLDLQVAYAPGSQPGFGVGKQPRPEAPASCLGPDCKAVDLPRAREVFMQRQEPRKQAPLEKRERRPVPGVQRIHEKRRLDPEPLGKRTKNSLALSFAVEVRSDDLQWGPNVRMSGHSLRHRKEYQAPAAAGSKRSLLEDIRLMEGSGACFTRRLPVVQFELGSGVWLQFNATLERSH